MNFLIKLYDKFTDFIGESLVLIKKLLRFKNKQKDKSKKYKEDFDTFRKTGEYEYVSKEEQLFNEYKKYTKHINASIIIEDINKSLVEIMESEEYPFHDIKINKEIKQYHWVNDNTSHEFYKLNNGLKNILNKTFDNLILIFNEQRVNSVFANKKLFEQAKYSIGPFGFNLKTFIERYQDTKNYI